MRVKLFIKPAHSSLFRVSIEIEASQYQTQFTGDGDEELAELLQVVSTYANLMVRKGRWTF